MRAGLRLTQDEMARVLGISRRTIIRWEQGQHLPTRDRDRRRRANFYRLWHKYQEWLDYEAQHSGPG